jgi:DICT domain-containing protein
MGEDEPGVSGLAIKEVAQRTGLAPATIRMWEQRYGFPDPERTPAGYRVYTDEHVETLRRVLSFREQGLSVPAALERARQRRGPTDRPSLYGAITVGDRAVVPRRLRKSTLLAISRAIEDEALARAAGPVVFAAFQRERNYRAVEHRYRQIARTADAVVVFADFDELRTPPGAPIEVPIGPEDALGNEWAVVVDAPGYAACLLAWEPSTPRRQGEERRFESLWTLDPRVVRHAAEVGASLVARADPVLGERLEALLARRPLAVEQPVPGLTALTNRILAYLEPPDDELERGRPEAAARLG